MKFFTSSPQQHHSSHRPLGSVSSSSTSSSSTSSSSTSKSKSSLKSTISFYGSSIIVFLITFYYTISEMIMRRKFVLYRKFNLGFSMIMIVGLSLQTFYYSSQQLLVVANDSSTSGGSDRNEAEAAIGIPFLVSTTTTTTNSYVRGGQVVPGQGGITHQRRNSIINTSTLSLLWESVWDDLLLNDNENNNPMKSYRTFGNAIPSHIPIEAEEDEVDGITLVTHATIQQLPQLLLQVQQWCGGGGNSHRSTTACPVSASIYISQRSDINQFIQFYQQYTNELIQVSFHIVLEKATTSSSKNIPHNLLRNLALDHGILTQFFISINVNSITPYNGHDRVINDIFNSNNGRTTTTTSGAGSSSTSSSVRDMLRSQKTLLVVPLFIMQQQQSKSKSQSESQFQQKHQLEELTTSSSTTIPFLLHPLPETKSDIISLLDTQKIHIPSSSTSSSSSTTRHHQRSTQYAKWLSIPPTTTTTTRTTSTTTTSTTTGTMESSTTTTNDSLENSENNNENTSIMYPINYEALYTPTVIGYHPGIPRYWNTIRGSQFDTISWNMELHYAGYTYSVLHDFFILQVVVDKDDEKEEEEEEVTMRNNHLQQQQVEALGTFGEYLHDTYHVDWKVLQTAFNGDDDDDDNNVLIHTKNYNKHLQEHLIRRVQLAYEAHETLEREEIVLLSSEQKNKKPTRADVDRLTLFAIPLQDRIQQSLVSVTTEIEIETTSSSTTELELFLNQAEPLVYTTPGHPYEILWDKEFELTGGGGDQDRGGVLYTRRKTFPNAFVATEFVERGDVTMATHTSVSKLERLLYQIVKWNGPTSVAIYLSSKDEIKQFLEWYSTHADTLRPLATFHVVLERPAEHVEYPHNILRNMALDHVKSDYFVALDVDFFMSSTCHEDLKSLIATHDDTRHALKYNKTLFVLPAFERFDFGHDLTPDMIPNTKDELLTMHHNGSVAGFHVENFPQGHGPTNFPKWLSLPTTSTTSNTTVTPEKSTKWSNEDTVSYPINFAHKFEPYVLGYRFGVPRYWPYFRGFGFNKLSWLVEAHSAGYQYAVLHDFFVVHMNHDKPSAGIDRSDIFMNNMKRIFVFNTYLNERYGTNLVDANKIFGELIRRVDEKDEYERAQVADRVFMAFHKKWLLSPSTRKALFATPLEDMLNYALLDLDRVQNWLNLVESRFPEDSDDKCRVVDPPTFAIYDFEFNDNPEVGHNVSVPHMIRSRKPVYSNDISLVTYGSVNMMPRLLSQIRQWSGPASVSVYVTSPCDIAKIYDFYEKHIDALSYSAFHILMEDGSLAYPHSMLQNLGLDNAETSYVLTLDADFSTPISTHDDLYQLLQTDETMRTNIVNNHLYILPTFQPKRHSNDGSFPQRKADMVAMIETGVAELHAPKIPKGFPPTELSRWWEIKAHKASRDAAFLVPRKRLSFEPTVLGYLPNFPRYWAGYRGHDYHKFSWNLDAAHTGQTFLLFWDLFVYKSSDHKSLPSHPNYGPAVTAEYKSNVLASFAEYLAKHRGVGWAALQHLFGKKELNHSDGHYLVERARLLRQVAYVYKLRLSLLADATRKNDTKTIALFAKSPEEQVTLSNREIREWLAEVEPLLQIS